MVEINIDAKDLEGKLLIPNWLLMLFGFCTSLLVTCHLMALMISTCILPNIEAVSNVHSVQAINESPHDQMRIYIELAWVFSTARSSTAQEMNNAVSLFTHLPHGSLTTGKDAFCVQP